MSTPSATSSTGSRWRAPRAMARSLASDRMARTSSSLMAVTVLNSGLGYVFWTIAARVFPPSEVGIANVVISTSLLIAILADLGTRSVVMQELPQSRGGRDWSRWVSTCMMVAATCAALLAVVGVFALAAVRDIHLFLRSAWPVAFVLLTVATALSNLFDGIATAERSASRLLSRNALTAAAKVVLLILCVTLTGLSWRGIVLVTAIATGAGVVFGYGSQLRRLHDDWRFTTRHAAQTVRSLRRSMVGHHLLNLGGQLPMYIMPIEVVVRLSSQANAYMSLTWMVGGAFLLVSPAVSSALFVQGRWSPVDLHATTLRAAKLIAALLVPLAAFMIVFGRLVLSIFGAGYAHHGYLLLCVLAASALPDAYTNVQIAVLRARKRLAEAALLNLSMASMAIVLTWLLLPHAGIVGVGWAWLIAQCGGSAFCAVRSIKAKPLSAA